MPATGPTNIHLREIVPGDLLRLFEFQLDPVANELAGTRPRERAAFEAVWEGILRDPAAAGVTPRAIVQGGETVGVINVFPQEGTQSIGYWIDRAHWGRGIATRAIGLMIAEIATRPLFARVVAHNAASMRALERNGFVASSREYRAATERYAAAEVVTLVLA